MSDIEKIEKRIVDLEQSVAHAKQNVANAELRLIDLARRLGLLEETTERSSGTGAAED